MGWAGGLSVQAYEEAVGFYEKHLGMEVLRAEDEGSLAKLAWDQAATAWAGWAFGAASMEVGRLSSLDGLKLRHTVAARIAEIA